MMHSDHARDSRGCPLAVTAELPKYEDRHHQVILHEAEQWEADLIVVGSHGQTGFDKSCDGKCL